VKFLLAIIASATISTAVIAEASAPQVDAPAPTTSTVQTTTTTTLDLAVFSAPADANCPQWWGLARMVGWQEQDLEMLDRVMWREARCMNVIGETSTQHAHPQWNHADWGLMQINKKVHQAFVEQIFQQPFPDAISEPSNNLRFALKLFQGSRWKAWGFKDA
jgi:hypothetical protein